MAPPSSAPPFGFRHYYSPEGVLYCCCCCPRHTQWGKKKKKKKKKFRKSRQHLNFCRHLPFSPSGCALHTHTNKRFLISGKTCPFSTAASVATTARGAYKETTNTTGSRRGHPSKSPPRSQTNFVGPGDRTATAAAAGGGVERLKSGTGADTKSSSPRRTPRKESRSGRKTSTSTNGTGTATDGAGGSPASGAHFPPSPQRTSSIRSRSARTTDVASLSGVSIRSSHTAGHSTGPGPGPGPTGGSGMTTSPSPSRSGGTLKGGGMSMSHHGGSSERSRGGKRS